MYGIASEIAQEIGVLFQHDDGNAGAREQEAKHHPGRSAASDTARRFDRDHGSSPRWPEKNRAYWPAPCAKFYACLSGVDTWSPSSSSVTLIWHDSREFGRTS